VTLLLIALVLPLLGGLLALTTGRRAGLAAAFGAGGAVLGSLCGLAAALRGLTAQAPLLLTRPWAVPGGSFALRLDGLAAFFLMPIFLLSLLAAIYAVGYLAPTGRERSLGPHWFFFNVLVTAMALVVTAANALLFLAAWELMSLSSFWLVAFEHRRPEVRQAAWVYLLATHLGVAFLFALFLLAGSYSGSLDFSAFSALARLPATPAALLFFLAVIGFGAKAGLFPFHVWLPDAHPAAPSHVSALMSAVMIKTGIYGILRIYTFLPQAAPWWGEVLMALGAAGAIFGIALAALQQDLKRVLAYSTVENIGIIVLALGLALTAAARGLPAIALLAMAAGLLHLWNHALFKGLMFFGAGAVLHETGTRDMDQLGGLLHRLPVTGTLLVGGSVAIAALPPLNGFVGEWLLYQGLLQSGAAGHSLAALYPFLLAGLLALAGGVAVVVFTRLVGIVLLGEPRSAAAAGAHEAPATMGAPMAVLFCLCLAVGLWPAGALRLVAVPVRLLIPAASVPPLVQSLAGFLRYLGVAALALLLLAAAAAILLRWWRRCRPVPAAATWGCGYACPTPRIAYTAEGYSELVQTHLLPDWVRPAVSGGVPAGLFPEPGAFHQQAPHPLFEKVFVPLFAAVAARCSRLRFLQQGKLHIYFLYIAVACAGLLGWLFVAERGWPW
jgi:formate hydrogenlyase subunit 3/multisubunit Na+/H+ antiporter MnhD subunit